MVSESEVIISIDNGVYHLFLSAIEGDYIGISYLFAHLSKNESTFVRVRICRNS